MTSLCTNFDNFLMEIFSIAPKATFMIEIVMKRYEKRNSRKKLRIHCYRKRNDVIVYKIQHVFYVKFMNNIKIVINVVLYYIFYPSLKKNREKLF